jgi:hypothetical protein
MTTVVRSTALYGKPRRTTVRIRASNSLCI